MCKMDDLKLMYIDIVGWYITIMHWLSAIVIWCDPFDCSHNSIKIINSDFESFTIGGKFLSARNQRIISWMYRWHDILDETDWKKCLTRFGLVECPTHVIKINDGPHIIVCIDLVNCQRTLSTYNGTTKHTSKIPIGGLSSSNIINDFIKFNK